MVLDIIVAAEHREAADAVGNADAGKIRVAGGGEGAAVVHGGTNRNSRGHLVVEKPSHFDA